MNREVLWNYAFPVAYWVRGEALLPSTLSGSVLQFGEYRLDCGRFELRRKDRPLPAQRKPMELLILLASREGQLVTRQEIAERLWSSEVFVDTEHGINTAIRKLRYLLRDDTDNPQFIQTVTGMGYRFVAPVSVVPPIASAMPTQPLSEPASPIASPARHRAVAWWSAGAAACVLLVLGGMFLRLRQRPPEVKYTQLTDFTDSAVAPTISPDGRMVGFVRGGNAFLSSDPIYVKMLPNGEARQVTDDGRPKYALAFSPDSSEIAYTVLDSSGFSTYVVSAFGGEPRLLLANAAGLVWLDPQRLLFSEVRSGIHLGVVTATVTRAGLREIYFPAHERGMAHDSVPSPDRRWALVVEMNGDGQWAPCRLVGLEGQSSPGPVGPSGGCTSAGWSPDGGWMYFTATVGGQSHIWRQRFQDGPPEQITFGPTEEDGLAVEPGGRSLITSVGVHESAIWIHDPSGERPLSSEGEVVDAPSPPVFSPDGRILYYLLRRGEGGGAELWRTMVDSGKSEPVFPGISMIFFDISPDGKQAVYTAAAPNGRTQLWLASMDRSSPATKVGIFGAQSPHFGLHGQILFQKIEGNSNYLEQTNADGSHLAKVLPYPIVEFQGVSPNRQWMMVVLPKGGQNNLPTVSAIPLKGGAARRVCDGYCYPRWSTDGKFLFAGLENPSRSGPGRSVAIPVGPGESLPDLPPAGFAALTDPGRVPGAESVARGWLVPGADPEHYAWVNTTVHRNLYRISLP
ncbi:MAG TPA: winged helix-turn-helix domain-containing protein [Silvibacterium sp.]|nr:winged helix-turn-helix domain-containing protein [Silvibacterium sp.]